MINTITTACRWAAKGPLAKLRRALGSVLGGGVLRRVEQGARVVVTEVDQALDLGAVDRLVLEQAAGDEVETVAMLGERVLAQLLTVPEDLLDLFVDDS